MPAWTSALSLFSLATEALARSRATPPPGTMPSSTAARVALECVVDAVLLLFHLDFGRAADADDRDAAGQLVETFLQLLLVVVRGGLFDLRLDLGDAASMSFFFLHRR